MPARPSRRTLTYKAAAAVQPFANTLVNIDMTGAQIRQALEQQWQRDLAGNIPSRPFLRLGTSKGFTYTYYETQDPTKPAGAMLGHVTGMYLDGVPIADATTYSVTVNSFLAAGGDNFRAFALGADKRDTGVTDLQATVDYMAANADPTPLAVDYGQHAVRVTFPAGAPATYAPGDTVEFDLASLAMTAPDDLEDTTIEVELDGDELGSFAVNNAASSQPERPPGHRGGERRASCRLRRVGREPAPRGCHDRDRRDRPDRGGRPPAGHHRVGRQPVGDAGQAKSVSVTVTPAGTDGTVEIRDGATVLGTGTVTAGAATVNIPAANIPAVGPHTLSLHYSGEAGAFSPSVGSFTLTVVKATPVIQAPDVTVPVGQTGSQTVVVTATGLSPTGSVTLKNAAATIETKPLAGGQATFTLPAVPDGTTLTVEYGGDADVLAGSTTFVVSKGAKAAATLASAGATLTYGTASTVSVNVATAASGVTPTGTVTLTNGATTLGTGTVSGGVATIALPARSLPPGSHTLAAVYSGDSNLNGAATTVPVTVGKVTSTTKAKVKPNEPKAGEKVKLKVTVTGENGVVPTGKVVVKVNGKKYTVTLKNGKATVKVGTLPKGTHKAKLKYAGDAYSEGSKTKVTIKVT